jgi:hypothetical protein
MLLSADLKQKAIYQLTGRFPGSNLSVKKQEFTDRRSFQADQESHQGSRQA